MGRHRPAQERSWARRGAGADRERLKEWKLACPLRYPASRSLELHYVSPTGKGRIESHSYLVQRHWWPLQFAAGVSVPVLDAEVLAARERALRSA
jgi:hypothetical protein